MKLKLAILAIGVVFGWTAAWAAPVAPPPRAEVVHWWTSRGESAALRVIASRFRAAGGIWIDTAVTGAEQARAVGVHRIIGGTPPAAVQFNTSKQFLDLIEEDMLENVDDLARKYDWDRTLPEPVRNVIKMRGHYYAVPISIHMPTWLWYSKSAFKKAGVRKAPSSIAEMFTALDKLKAAGLVPMAQGDQPWQLNLLFMAIVAYTVDKELYLRVFRDNDAKAVRSPEFRQALLTYKRLRGYVDADSRGRDWQEASAMVMRGEAGMQIMGDWIKGELVAADMRPGEEVGCVPSLSADGPLVVQGDAFIFPKSERSDVRQAQKLLSGVMVAPQTQAAFSRAKGSIPLSVSEDLSTLDACTRMAISLVKDSRRHVGNTEAYISAGQNGALEAVLTVYWNTSMPVQAAQQGIIDALRR